MIRFAANLSMLFTELDFMDRFEAAARAGFRGVEYLFPYDYDPKDLAERLKTYSLTQALHNLPAGDWDAGERGIACHPDRVDEFRDGVERAAEYATALGCAQVNCLAGIAPPDVPTADLRGTFVANLKYAAGRLERDGIGLLIEPINTRDVPGFYLSRSRQASDVIDAVASGNLLLQYDVYHMQVMEGDLAQTLSDLAAVLGHVQIADNPGRHEPGTGEINYPFIFQHLERLGYQGWIGCEYKPAATTGEGLSWFQSYRDA
jgi:hydroxypyruvate isomerase